jgi:hypothetical protein
VQEYKCATLLNKPHITEQKHTRIQENQYAAQYKKREKNKAKTNIYKQKKPQELKICAGLLQKDTKDSENKLRQSWCLGDETCAADQTH